QKRACRPRRSSSAPRALAPPLRRSGDPLGPLALGAHAHDAPRQAAALEAADQPGAGVELVRSKAVASRGWEGMVVVVPGLAEGDRRQPGEVARLVPRR